jgi:hypothetical protein
MENALVHLEPSILLAGDHVRVWRGLYWHHAIHIGDGWLIEFGSGVQGGVVAWVHLNQFSRGAAVDIVARGGQLAVQRAKSQLGKAGFHLLFRNCEHFANWCVKGRWESSQVAQAAGLIALGAFVLLASKAQATTA